MRFTNTRSILPSTIPRYCSLENLQIPGLHNKEALLCTSSVGVIEVAVELNQPSLYAEEPLCF